MGIFDSLKNMTNQTVKNNVSKAVSGAVNNAMHKSKTFVFADYPKNADELKKMPELDFSSPLSTAAFAMLVLLEYDESPENTIEMLNVLKGPQPMNGMDVQFLRDRIKGRGYIPRSYFEGSSVKNDYTPNVPYKITVSEYAYTYQSEGYAKVQVQSSGADSPRPIELRRRAINGSYGVILHSLTYELRLRLILGHEGGIFMKIKKKVKRISSVVLCFLMLLTTLPMTAITANAAAQAYIKYIDTEVYIGDVLNIIVGVNGGSTGETFTYQWQAKYPSLNWVNLSDKTDRPNSKFSGVFTDHLKFQTYAELVGPDSGWKDVVFRCKVTGSKSGTFYSGKCNFPGLLEKTEIPIIGFLGLEKPEQRKIPSTTATPINSTYYSFDYIEWYEYKNNKVSRKLNDGEAFDSGMYCCQLYFNMNRGYAVAKNAVCGLYNDDGQATILQDETTGQYYIWAYYVVADKSPSFSHQSTEAEIMKGKEGTISVTANNAASYQWQMKVRRSTGRYVWRNISDNSSTSNKFSFKGTKTNALSIRPNTDFDETHFRCAVTGENGDVIYSVSVKVTQKVKARIILDLRTGGLPDDTITIKFDKYTPDGVYNGSYTHETVNSNAKPLYVYYETVPGKYVITVSKPQCVTRVYEANVVKKDVNLVVKITVPYDVNMDGVINVVDATLVQKYIVGFEEFDDYTLKIADTNGDGTISVVDATNIQKKIVNLL